MQLAVPSRSKRPVKSRSRSTPVPSKKTAWRKREGAGRPSLHPGKVLSRHVTCYLTPDGWKKLEEVQDQLLRRNKELNSISFSDAMEEGLHKLHRELTRPR